MTNKSNQWELIRQKWILKLNRISDSLNRISGFKGKTLWDLLQLLIIPAVIAGFALWFNRNDAIRQENIALDQQQYEALQSYLDGMEHLLLDNQLRTSDADAEVRAIARARTLTVLRGLDSERKATLVQFLYESDLINSDNPIVLLSGADLRYAYLKDANLQYAFLEGADLWSVNLTGAKLWRANLVSANLEQASLLQANLQFADLRDADLRRTDLWGAYLLDATLMGTDLQDARMWYVHMQRAFLEGANLTGADLRYSNLENANLKDASFKDANLENANLVDVDLEGAYLESANLEDADLEGAYLKNAWLLYAKVTDEQLAEAKSLEGATMPDGKIYDGRFDNKVEQEDSPEND